MFSTMTGFVLIYACPLSIELKYRITWLLMITAFKQTDYKNEKSSPVIWFYGTWSEFVCLIQHLFCVQTGWPMAGCYHDRDCNNNTISLCSNHFPFVLIHLLHRLINLSQIIRKIVFELKYVCQWVCADICVIFVCFCMVCVSNTCSTLYNKCLKHS